LIRLGSGSFPVSFVDSVLALFSVELLSSPTVTSCDNDSSISYIIKTNFRHSWMHLTTGRAEVFILSALKFFG
jgi:hypothetical protein